jgi:hypothetical protein
VPGASAILVIFESGLDLALLMCLWAFCGAIVVVEGWDRRGGAQAHSGLSAAHRRGLLVVEMLPDRVHVWAPAE